jgi:hypothetical protein
MAKDHELAKCRRFEIMAGEFTQSACEKSICPAPSTILGTGSGGRYKFNGRRAGDDVSAAGVRPSGLDHLVALFP